MFTPVSFFFSFFFYPSFFSETIQQKKGSYVLPRFWRACIFTRFQHVRFCSGLFWLRVDKAGFRVERGGFSREIFLHCVHLRPKIRTYSKALEKTDET